MASRPDSTLSTAISHVTSHAQSPESSRATPITPAHRSWTAYSGPVLFTGPSGLRDHQVKTEHDFQMVGDTERSSEVTSQMRYLTSTAPGAAFPKAKNGQVGEIGWAYEKFGIVKGI